MRRIPQYPRKVNSSGRVRVRFQGRAYYLPGKLGSPESLAEYARLIAEFAAGVPKPTISHHRITVEELAAAYLLADTRGAEHPQVERVARACAPAIRLFGPTVAAEFSATRLEQVQLAMVSGSWMTDEERATSLRWSKSYIDQQIGRIRKVFRWGELRELIPAGRFEHLRTLPAIRADPRVVKINPPREVCDWEKQVVPVLPFLSPAFAAVVQIQFYGGMRPSEALNIRRGEIDRRKLPDVWLYCPPHHKGTHRSVMLIKGLGPKAQAVLAPWLLLCADDDAPLFRRHATNRPYTAEGYSAAVQRACRRAGVKPWCPYQLRHLARLTVTQEFGLEAARAVLGHSSVSMTAQYSRQIDIATIAEVMRKIG